MSPKVHAVQSLKFPRLQHGTQATMPAQQSLRTAKSPRAAWSLWRVGVVIGLLAAGCFALGLRDAPFVDEYAYITQSYQPDLVFSGRMNDISWLDGLDMTLFPCPSSGSISHSAQPGFLALRDETPSPGTPTRPIGGGPSASWSSRG